MAEKLTSAALAILLGWVVFALTILIADGYMAMLTGLVTGVGCALALRDTLVLRALVALLAPFGVMLPALALRHVAITLEVPMRPFATWELAGFLLGYLVFLASAMGVFRVDLYRQGYAPLPVAVMVLAVCGYGAVTGNWFLPLVAVLGQAAWLIGWGSSNWFDHVLHALLVPVTVVALMIRLF